MKSGGYAFDVTIVIGDDLIYAYSAREMEDEKFSIYEKNEKWNETEYLFVDRKRSDRDINRSTFWKRNDYGL